MPSARMRGTIAGGDEHCWYERAQPWDEKGYVGRNAHRVTRSFVG